MELKDKYVLITGGANRIGKSIALHFAKAGCLIILHYNRSKDEAIQVKSQIENLGSTCHLIQGDFTSPSHLNKMIEKHHDLILKTSILINSASLYSKAPLESITDETFNPFFNIHVLAPLKLSKLIGLHLKSNNESGVIINITDAMLRHPYPSHLPYFASKAALQSLTQTLAHELAPHVRVNAIAPGCILFPKNTTDNQKQSLIKTIPLKKAGQPIDIANACLFLSKANYINAITLFIDGGRSI